MDDDALVKQLIYCVLGALLFLFGRGWIELSFVTKIRRYFSPIQRQINDLQLELKQHKAEIAQIPIMDQFAANRKKQRIIDKVNDDLKELIKKRDQQEMKSNVFSYLFKFVCPLLGIYLAGKSSDLSVFTMSSSHFYPFNFLLTYPSAAGANPNETSISLFSFIILSFFTSSVFYKRVLGGKFNKPVPPIHPDLD